MARIIVTDTASADQATILSYLHEQAGLRTAIKFRGLFSALYDRLADHPASGPSRPALGPDIRVGIVFPYIIIYRYSENDDTVAVLRIVHAHQEITRKLLSGNP